MDCGAHVLSVTLSQRKSTKEVYRKLMRNMRTDAIVNQWLTTRTPTAPLVPFVKSKDNQRHPGPHLPSMGPYLSQATTEATKGTLDRHRWL